MTTRINEKKTRARVVAYEEDGSSYKVDLTIQDEKQRLWACRGCRLIDNPDKSPTDSGDGVWMVDYCYQNRLGMAIEVTEVDLVVGGTWYKVVPDYAEVLSYKSQFRSTIDNSAMANLFMDKWRAFCNG